MPATFAGYANDVARWVSVLEDNTSYCEYPAGSSWGGWYDGQVPYSEVTKYLNIIQPLYADVAGPDQCQPCWHGRSVGLPRRNGAVG